MNIDEKIQKELQQEAKSVDEILVHDQGLFTMLASAFKGSLGRWLILVTIITSLITLLMFWSGYHFFFVESLAAEKLHWGVLLLLSAMVQIALKMWTFMEMNRQSLIRESKRLELSVEILSQKVEQLSNKE